MVKDRIAMMHAGKTELLVSRLCHELVGAAGALSNGTEFLCESGNDGLDQDVLSMLSRSSSQLTTRLKFYRVAYGAAGLGESNLLDLRQLALDFFDNDETVTLHWPLAPVAPTLSAGEGRLILNLMVMAKSFIPMGGEIFLEYDEDRLAIELKSSKILLPEFLEQNTSSSEAGEELSIHNVHNQYCQELLQQLGKKIQAEEEINDTNQVKICRLTID